MFLGDRNLPPYEFLESSEPKGANVDLMRAVGRVLGRPVELRLMDWADAQERLQRGEGHALTMFGQSPERDPYYDFSQRTLPVTWALFVRADEQVDFTARRLPGKRIGVPRGGLAATYLEPQHPEATLVVVDDLIDGTKKLLRGEIDALAAQAWSERFLLAELNIHGISELPPFVQRHGNVAVREGERELLAEIDRALTELKRSGEFEQIIDRWSSTRLHLVSEFALRVVIIAAVIAVVALALLTAALIHLRRQRTALTREIVERQRVEEELRRATEQAQAASRAKTTFLAAASHDLRQPLQALGLFLGVMRSRAGDHTYEELVDHALKAFTGAESLLNALLDFSRLEAGAVNPAVRDFALAEVLEPLIGENRELAAGKGLSLRYRPLDVVVSSDPVLLLRIVRNLLANAVRYTRTGGILLACRRRGEMVYVEVWDTGIGIPSEKLGTVFDEFYQLDNTARDEVKGLGLGLSIVAKTADLLGHEVSACSRLGRGSRFRVVLPLSRSSPPAVPRKRAAELT